MIGYFDREGSRISLEEFGELDGQKEYKRIAWDDLPSGGYVSTVWLGIDHSYTGVPLIFETMVFPEREICVRYSTKDEALAGHARILKEQMGGGK